MTEPPPESPAPDRSRRLRSRARRWLLGLLIALALLVVVVLSALLALQNPVLATRFVNAALHRLPALARSTMRVEHVSGSWIGGLDLTGFRMMRGDTLLIAADTVRVRYRSASLLGGRLDAQDLLLAGVVVTADLVDTTASRPKPKRAPLTLGDVLRGRFYTGPAFAVDRLTVRSARYGGRFGVPDSSSFLTDVDLRAHGVRLGRSFSFQVDSLTARRSPVAGAGAIDLALVAGAVDGHFDLRSLELRTDSSAAQGTFQLGVDPHDRLSEVRVHVHSQRFALHDLRALIPGFPLEGVARVDIDLDGPDPRHLTGPLVVQADRARWGKLRFDGFDLDAPFQAGRSAVTLSTRFQDAPVAITGWIEPTDSLQGYDLELRSSRLPRAIPGADWWAFVDRAAAGATVRIRGNGLARPVGDVTGRIAGEAGAIDFGGRISLQNGFTWEARRLSLTDFDLARVLGDTTASSLTGILSGGGQIGGTGQDRLSVAADLKDSQFDTWRADEARARLSLAGDRLGASLRLSGDVGTIVIDSLAGQWTPSGTLQLRGVRFTDLDLARVTGNAALTSRLAGSVRGRMRGLPSLSGTGGPMPALRVGRVSADLQVDLQPSSFRAQPIHGANLRTTLTGGETRVNGTVESAAGRADIDTRARPFDREPTWAVRSGRFRDVDLAAWTGSRGMRSQLSGRLTARGTGTTGDGVLELDRSRFGTTELAGAARGSWSRERADLTADLRSGAETVRARFDLTPHEGGPSGNAEVTIPVRLLAALAGRDTVASSGSVVAHASFRGTAPATASADGALTGSGRMGAVRVDSLFAGFHMRRGVLVLDTLLTRSNVGSAAGAGQVALFDSTAASDLRARVRVTDARPLTDLLAADTLSVDTTSLDLRVHGAGGSRTFQVEGTMRSLAWNDIRLQHADGTVAAELDANWHPVRSRVDASIRRLRGLGLPVYEAHGRLDVERDSARFDLTGNRDATHRLHVVGGARTDSASRHLTFERIDVVADTANWALARPARIDLGKDRFTIHDFELLSTGGRLDAHGVIDRRGEQDFHLSMKDVGLDILAVWLGRENLTGVLNGSLQLQGPARTPRGSGDLVTALRVDGRPAGIVSSSAKWNGSRLDFAGRFATPHGDSIAWTGDLPLAISLAVEDSSTAARLKVVEGEVDVRVRAAKFPLDAFSPLLDPRTVGQLAGTLDLDARLRGNSREVSGTGRVDVAGGVLPLPGLGAVYRDLEFHGAFERDRLVVNRAHAISGKGTLDATGDVRFVGVSRIEPRLKVDLKKFVFVETQDLRAVASGSLDLGGTVTSPVVKGKATIENSNFYLVQSDLQDPNSTVRLTDADLRMLEETFGDVSAAPPNFALDLYDASTLDLAITLERNNWVRQRIRPKMSVALTGDFQMKKEPHGEPQLFGKIAPIPGRGYVEQFARSFDITGGEVLLNGPMTAHRVNIQAQYKPPSRSDSDEDETMVKLDVEGTIDKMKLILSSEPAMSEVEIIDFIATGRSRTDPGTASSDANLAKDIGLSQVTGLAEERAQEAIGLDVLQVRFDALQGATLVAGRYLDPQLYVGFRQPLQYKDTSAGSNSDVTTSTSVEVEYAIHQWLVLNLQGETSKLRSFIRVRHAY